MKISHQRNSSITSFYSEFFEDFSIKELLGIAYLMERRISQKIGCSFYSYVPNLHVSLHKLLAITTVEAKSITG